MNGEITHRTKRDIAVVILEPYNGFSNCRHIPCFTIPSKDYTGTYGIETAKHSLHQIYTIGKEAEELAHQFSEIIKKWDEFDSEIHKITQEKNEQKRLLRRKFKLREINQTQHQQTLMEMNRALISCNIRLTDFFDDNIQPYFSSTIPFSLRNKVIDFIRNECLL